ncbi:MAG: cytochrome c [Flavobacteriales bacterium]|nr:cytochrome c [Flavobacteriales bacterium]
MNKVILSITLISMGLIISCGGGDTTAPNAAETAVTEAPKADPKGIGAITSVTLTDPMEQSMIASGKAIYEMKCSACHKLDGMRVVGPGFSGITNRRRPEWVMNMITNTEVMLEKDPAAQALLEECLMRMPNQNLSTGDARDVLEFMRKNDEDTAGKKDGAVNS